MKNINIIKYIQYSILTSVLLLVFSACTTVETPPKIIDPKVLSCCPGGGGLLDSLVNNNLDSTNEYAPYIVYGSVNDVLWFSSSRERGIKGKKETFYPGELMFSSRPASMRNKCPNEGWSKAQKFTTSDELFETWSRGSVAFTGNSMIIAAESALDADVPMDAHGTSYEFDLWELQGSDGNYDHPKKIKNVNSPFWESQPALSPDGKVLFFVSDRPLGNEKKAGDLNIWYSVKKGDEWSEAKPVTSINSRGSDISPHWGADGKFYFSSNWSRINDTLSTTGFDIYVCENFQNIDGVMLPTDPVNANTLKLKSACGPESQLNINTSANEMFPFVTADKKAIYWSSDRAGGYGKLDIYGCALPEPCIRIQVTVRKRLIDTTGGKKMLVQDYTNLTSYKLRLSGAENRTIQSDIEEKLYPGKKYTVSLEPVSENCYDCFYNKKEFSVETFFSDTVVRDTINFDCYKKSKESVVLAGGHIPFFITGYWWPSTSENVSEFKKRKQSGNLDTSFIDSRDYDYFNSSTTNEIDRFFEENIYKKLEKIAGDIYSCNGDDIIAVTLRGYTDECRLMPGKYTADETVTVGDIIIPSGWQMRNTWAQTTAGTKVTLPEQGQNGNIVLSKLRAYYTYKTIENAMNKRSEAFKKLGEKGQIIYDYEGYGIYDRNNPCKNDTFDVAGKNLSNKPNMPENCNKPMSRRISVYFDVVPHSAKDYYKLTRCGDYEEEYLARLNALKPEPEPEKDITPEKQKPVEEGGASGCTGPNCYMILYGEVGNMNEFTAFKELLGGLGIEVLSEQEDNGKIRIVSARLTEENAQKTLENYKTVFENFIRPLAKKLVFKAEVLKIGS